MNGKRHLILASASPRRKCLLEAAGYRFEVIPSNIREEEHADWSADPQQVAEQLAYRKAKDVADRVATSAVVLGADTLVVVDDQILGKGQDEDDARRMLLTLSRTRHRVITGVALVDTDRGRTSMGSEVSWVTMKPMSPAEIDAYLATGAWRDKAGSYAVQEGADAFITRIDGSYTNVVGLPMERVVEMLREFGVNGE